MNEIILINKNELVDTIEKTISNRLQNLESLISKLNSGSDQKTYLSRKETAKLFSVSLVTLHKWVKKGYLNPHYIGNRVYFKYEEIINTVENL